MARSSLEIFTLTTGQARVVLQSDRLIEAPNWHPEGWLMVNAEGQLWRVPLDAPALHQIPMDLAARCNNDHGFTRDGRAILFSAHRGQGAEIFRMALAGGAAECVSPQAPSWFHGTSPDGRAMVYPAVRGGGPLDIYTKPFDGPERRLTRGEGHADGPEFSADGQRIYFNSDRSGHAQIWVMAADGSGQRPLFVDENVNWFPHPSPDGRHLVYLAYPPGTLGHPRDLPVALWLCDPEGGQRRQVVQMTGGQGSLNAPCWAPDGSAFAFLRYHATLPCQTPGQR
jgi:Tol biopolymer transport system component